MISDYYFLVPNRQSQLRRGGNNIEPLLSA